MRSTFRWTSAPARTWQARSSPSPISRRCVTGTVTNPQGQAVSDYTLIVYPVDQRYWLPQSRRIRSIRPATDGTFSLTGLPAGDYRIAPELDPEPGSWFDAPFLQQLDSSPQRFSLADGEKKTLAMKAGS